MTDVRNKKRKVSKKRKKSWRKHVDTKDVDEFLDNVRFDERLGQPFSEKPDSQLFTIDKNSESNDYTSKSDRRYVLKNKEVKCFSLLKPHTLVPDPIVKRNRVKHPEERKNPITRRIESEKKLKGLLKVKEKIAAKDRAFAKLKQSMKPKRDEFSVDIWESNTSTLPIDTSWMTSDSVRHTFSHLGLKKKRTPPSLHKRTSVLPSVEIPHPGSSYNPSYTDHQDLLKKVAQREIELIKEEAHLNRVTTQMFQKVSLEERDKNMINELSEGLCFKNKEYENDNCPSTDNTVKSVNPPVKNVKKTLKQRRKQKEEKDLINKRMRANIEKKKIADIYKLKRLQKQLHTKEKQQLILKEEKLLKRQAKLMKPKILSKVKFEPLDLDFKLAEELTGNLRNSEPGGSLLKDRYKSLQQRNIVAPGNQTIKRVKAKMKKFQKPDHKID